MAVPPWQRVSKKSEREKDRPFPALNDSAVADVLHHKNLLLLTLKDKWRSNAILFLKKQTKAL